MLCNYSINNLLNLPEKFIIQKKIIENESYIYLSLSLENVDTIVLAVRKDFMKIILC